MARILSIEDDPDTHQLIGKALFQEGYDVHYAWNGKEGYEKVLKFKPDVILLDLLLPIMNGVEFMKKMRESKSTKDIPIIIVTGFGGETGLLGDATVTQGAVAYLRKPVDVPELLNVVKQALANSPGEAGAAAVRGREVVKGSVRADPRLATVWVNDRLIATLPRKRFALLQRLMDSPGPVPASLLLKDLGYGPSQVNALKQTLHRLRLDLGPSEGRRIRTTPEGYELVG